MTTPTEHPLPKTALVTGATGFVGSHLVRALVAQGVKVRAAGRNFYQTGRVWHPDVERFSLDLRDSDAVAAGVEGMEWVFHAGAFSSPWGKADAFWAVNVDGTRALAEAALDAGVTRFIHVSSTSIYFADKGREDVDEDSALAPRMSSDYAASKAAAEEVINELVEQRDLPAVLVRARAVFGPGDNAIVPRLLEAAEKKRLRMVGSGDNRVDLTYVDNLVDALLLAGQRGRTGEAYIITNDEPAEVWPLLERLGARVGHKLQPGRVPYPVAKHAAAAVEALFRQMPQLGTPPITRYTVGLVATNQLFDISKAKRELGYKPRVSLDEGINATADFFVHRSTRVREGSVRLKLFYSAHTHAPRGFVLQGGRGEAEFACFAALVDHPHYGLTLFDTGYAPRLNTIQHRMKGLPYRLIAGVEVGVEHSVANQMRAEGIDPGEVRRVVISHLHADHLAGLRDFTSADIVMHHACLHRAKTLRGPRTLTGAFFPELLPDDFGDRAFGVPQFHDEGFGEFAHTHDLFGDGSLRLVSLPGHDHGHMGMLTRTDDGELRLFVGDACWLSDGFRNNTPSSNLTRVITASRREEVRTLRNLHRLHLDHPDVEVLPTHCPEVRARYGDGAWR